MTTIKYVLPNDSVPRALCGLREVPLQIPPQVADVQGAIEYASMAIVTLVYPPAAGKPPVIGSVWPVM